jgi:hypothetical protein
MRRRRRGASASDCTGTLSIFDVLVPAARVVDPPAANPTEGIHQAEAFEVEPPDIGGAIEAAARRSEKLSRGTGPDRSSGEPLGPAAAGALAASTIEGTRLRLPTALPREVYEEVAQACKRIGGRWVRRGPQLSDGAPAGYYEFPDESADLLDALARAGLNPPKNPTALFPSPPHVVDRIIELADLDAAGEWEPYRFLEPHAGRGAIADRIQQLFPTCPLDVVEILDVNLHVLRRKGYKPIAADFLQFDPGPVYDRILANPPFSLPGAPKAYQQHIRHAWNLLSPRGVLVAVIPAYIPRCGTGTQAFERWIADRGEMEELPAGSFRGRGTEVATALVCLDKRATGWKRRPFCGWGSWHAWQTALYAENTASLYTEERQLFAEVEAGAFGRNPLPPEGPRWAMAAAVQRYYTRAIDQLNRSPYYAGVFPSDEDFNELIAHFVTRYQEARGHESGKPVLGRAA